MDLLRRGLVSAGVGLDDEWEGWPGIDALNRLFAGREPVSSGIGIQLFDKTHNTPAEGADQAPLDFRAAYRKACGVG
jgi:hypothetical protein